MTTATNIGVTAASRFRDTSNVVTSAAQWLEYLNEAYADINTRNPLWPWLETAEQSVTVTAGSRSASLPTGVWTVNWVYNATDDYRLIPQEGRGDQWHQDRLRSETGQPVTYRLRANTLELFPLPLVDTVCKMECMLAPAALAGGDTPVFGPQWDAVLIEGMLAKAYLDDGNVQWYTTHQARFDKKVTEMMAWFMMARTETYVPIRDVFWS